jgi:histidine ammonia-lyase
VQPQDSYSLRCVPQVHGAVRDAAAQAARVLEIELNAVTDHPLVFREAVAPRVLEDQVRSAGHVDGLPLALAA